MVIRTPENHGYSERRHQSAPDQWISMLRQMPCVRVEKVVAAREKLRENRLDDERILDETLDRLQEVLLEDHPG
jgi:hypothetical protein